MKRRPSTFTLVELMVVMAVIGLLVGLLLPALMAAREQSRRKSCSNNLGQIGKACIAYQEPNGDYFPAFLQQATYYPVTPTSDTLFGGTWAGRMVIPVAGSGNPGSDGTFQPMPSLACLYPTYLPEVKVFACPSTTDTPQIAFQYYNVSANVSVLHTCFGFDSWARDPKTGALINTVDPAVYTGNEVSTRNKCSYLYDELTQPRDLSADQAMAADADGQTWLLPGGGHPGYATGWRRTPRQPNHDNGQNVMYIDGHVKWTDTAYSSHDPADNIFCQNGFGTPGTSSWQQWGADTDAYLWDGLESDSRSGH
jgi:prepilin-type N-terminal cleavage/methylation domain-containing protein/prepilin-type processing-associated H-X9-DG protein